MNDFAFDFLKNTIRNDNTPTNKLTSPLSIFLALCMLYIGADNATRDSIRYALRLPSNDMQHLNNVCKELFEGLLVVDNRVTLSIANSVWYSLSAQQPIPAFLTIANAFYHATVQPTDFNSSSALDTINNWIAANTNQKIKKALSTINPADLLYLINTIYFKGTWTKKFEVSNTMNEDFHNVEGRTVSAPFMIQENTIRYAHSGNIQLAELPYSGGAFNLYILLPDANLDAKQALATLNTNSFQQLLSDTKTVSRVIHLPKWKSSYRMDSLRPELRDMGMDIAFTGAADFSKMYTNPVMITKSIHQTFIEVNVEGTEAAAVALIGAGTTASAPPEALRFDRPFIYVIAEKTSGTILFTGILNDPSMN